MSLELIIFFMIIIVLIVTWIKYDISAKKTEINYIKILVFVSVFFIITALFSPLLIFVRFSNSTDFSSAELGPIGDFLAGSTVPFLTTGSILLLLATILMQRQEVKISQDGIKQLNEQTLIVKKQYEETRKETILTNKTLKKQQFETTFFNMISLHHTLVNNMKYGESMGRNVFEDMFEYLKNNSLEKAVEEKWQIYLYDLLSLYEINNFINFEESRKNLFRDLYIYYRQLTLNDNNVQTIYSTIDQEYEEDKLAGFLEFKGLLDKVRIYNPPVRNPAFSHFTQKYIEQPDEEFKEVIYKETYKKFGNTVGHYYRNLYRIFRFIEEEFSDIKGENNTEKNKYRGILRAQLSSVELMMLFYNITYSSKGEKFKELIRNKNFFDDHLEFNDFLWENDYQELRKYN